MILRLSFICLGGAFGETCQNPHTIEASPCWSPAGLSADVGTPQILQSFVSPNWYGAAVSETGTQFPRGLLRCRRLVPCGVSILAQSLGHDPVPVSQTPEFALFWTKPQTEVGRDVDGVRNKGEAVPDRTEHLLGYVSSWRVCVVCVWVRSLSANLGRIVVSAS
jgi:hypothetical protein